MSESVRIANDAAPGFDEELGAEPLPLPVREGDVIADKYRIDAMIGIGGMAAVLRATHLELDQVVAIKLLRPEHVAKADAVKRFLREARAAVKLRSTHVARVLDVGTADISPAMQVPYMVMEHLEGSDFESLLQAHGVFPQEKAVEYILQACDAVGEAHALGIVHRDLKPANLFLTTKRDGTALVKLLDFGISKTTDGSARPLDQKITHEHATMGSPAYMSPEQVRSPKDVDARADIWGLGAILFELLTGKEPWSGETSADTFAMILTEPVPRIRDVNPDVHPDLEAIVFRCLEKDRLLRFQTIGELANALVHFVPRRNHSVAPTWDSGTPPAPTSGFPSSQRLAMASAMSSSQRIPIPRAPDSQRVMTPAPMPAWTPPPPSSGHLALHSSGHISLAPASSPRSFPSGRMPAIAPATKTAPWWQLPAILGAIVGLLTLGGIVLVFASRARLDSARAATSAASASPPVASTAANAVANEEPPPLATADPLPAVSASSSATSTPHRAPVAAPIAKPKAAASGIPRHRTDW